jgi:hypothetical protein
LKLKPGGFATLPLRHGGRWHLVYQCARRGNQGAHGQWTIYSATLSFSAQGPPPAAAPPPRPAADATDGNGQEAPE